MNDDFHNIKILRQLKRPRQLTSQDAMSYQADGCYVIPMTITKRLRSAEFREELDAWDAASDEALEIFTSPAVAASRPNVD